MAERASAARKTASAAGTRKATKKAAGTTTADTTTTTTSSAGRKTSHRASAAAATAGQKTAATAPAAGTDTGGNGAPGPAAEPKRPARVRERTAAQTEEIRRALAGRRDELRAEYDHTMAEINELQRDRLTDSAGDDQADTGTKTFEREQEILLANGILERIGQVERALERLDEGSYGWCERCGNQIPVERLAAFPSATLCVTCKQLEERR